VICGAALGLIAALGGGYALQAQVYGVRENSLTVQNICRALDGSGADCDRRSRPTGCPKRPYASPEHRLNKVSVTISARIDTPDQITGHRRIVGLLFLCRLFARSRNFRRFGLTTPLYTSAIHYRHSATCRGDGPHCHAAALRSNERRKLSVATDRDSIHAGAA
jgi:hypothetical protein